MRTGSRKLATLAAALTEDLVRQYVGVPETGVSIVVLPQDAFRRPFHIEHIIAKQHGEKLSLKISRLLAGTAICRKVPIWPESIPNRGIPFAFQASNG